MKKNLNILYLLAKLLLQFICNSPEVLGNKDYVLQNIGLAGIKYGLIAFQVYSF